MSEVVWIGAYRRRKPARPATYREVHNRLFEEVMERREIEDAIALALAADFELREGGYVKGAE